MAVIGWGKPRLIIKDLNADTPSWKELPTPAEDTTQLETTKGDKTEAKIEGGANEDVKYNKNTYALNFGIRAAKGRPRPVEDEDGVVKHNYAIVLQPEDDEVQGFAIENSTVSIEDTFSAAEGGMWNYSFDALVPADGSKQVKWGRIKISENGSTITDVEISYDNGNTWVKVADTSK